MLLAQRKEDCSTRGLFATDHVILNHGQVTWPTPEPSPPSPNYHITPTEDVSALDRFNVHRCPTRLVFSGTGLELVTRQATIRYLYLSATAADNMLGLYIQRGIGPQPSFCLTSFLKRSDSKLLVLYQLSTIQP
ncbi:uncharacterized protein TNCV_3065391 [Trichonephila clavipes]|uniref:Uncharacterized protein n=1 Tax=Trichonephila clavipes TaxID=2585209 RepID=A0A8X6UYI1_TRICX|nr:uncharacterized protein TNCV_3065391 [Trichonephila clavipes]